MSDCCIPLKLTRFLIDIWVSMVKNQPSECIRTTRSDDELQQQWQLIVFWSLVVPQQKKKKKSMLHVQSCKCNLKPAVKYEYIWKRYFCRLNLKNKEIKIAPLKMLHAVD